MGHSRTRGGREGGPRCCTHLSGSDPTQGGQWGEEEQHDIGGITWQTTSGWGRRRRRHGAASVMMMTMTMTTMATGEKDVEGRWTWRGRGGEEGEEVCLAVLIIDTRCTCAGGIFFPVVLLCQFLVLAGNRLWFCILMYLEYNIVVVLC